MLDQIHCNGILEGIWIARIRFPNRLSFSDFLHQYEVLCPKDYLDPTQIILEKLGLDKALYRIGRTNDTLIQAIMSTFHSITRWFTRGRFVKNRLYRAETRIIWHNFQVYIDFYNYPWWSLFVRMKPLLGVSTNAMEVKKGDQEQTVEAMEAALFKIITSDLKDDEPNNSPFESVD